jgi:hypothetical protein
LTLLAGEQSEGLHPADAHEPDDDHRKRDATAADTASLHRRVPAASILNILTLPRASPFHADFTVLMTVRASEVAQLPDRISMPVFGYTRCAAHP